MSQILHGSATTTEAVRRAIQNSQERLRALFARYGINQKTVAKWKKRISGLPTEPGQERYTMLSVEDEAAIIAFRKHRPPLDDCLRALQPTLPHLMCSSLHQCLQRYGISRPPEAGGSSRPGRNSKATQLAISTLALHKCRQLRANSASSWPSAEPPGSLSQNAIAQLAR